jgi:hypothetical protein
MKTFSKQRLERQKGQQWAGDKPLLEIGQIVLHKAHLLTNNIAKLKNNQQPSITS